MQEDSPRFFGQYPAQVTCTIDFSEKDLFRTRSGQYDSLSVKGCHTQGAPGQPRLPWRKIYVSVPWDAVPRDDLLEYTIKKVTDLGRASVEPGQLSVPTLERVYRSRVELDERLYDRKVTLPERQVRLVGLRRTGGFAVIELEVCPVQYHLLGRRPRSGRFARSAGKLTFIQQLQLVVWYQRSGERQMSSWHGEEHRKRVQGMVVNPEDVCTYAEMAVGQDPDGTEKPKLVDYVIITSRQLKSFYKPLVEHRYRLGKRARIVTTQAIKRMCWGDSTLDDAEAIRDFIKWANINWSTEYFLLGGGQSTVPVRRALHSKAGRIEYGKIDVPDARNLVQGFDPKKFSWTIDDEGRRCITVSIAPPHAVNRLKLTWDRRWFGVEYTFEVSTDKANWYQVLSRKRATKEECVDFKCVPAVFARLCVTSSGEIALREFQVFGPRLGDFAGVAFRLTKERTRICLGTDTRFRPTKNLKGSKDEDLLLIKEGCHAGTQVPYDTDQKPADPSWRYVESLWDVPGTSSGNPSQYLEVYGSEPYHGNDFVFKFDHNFIPTDLYYSDISAYEYPPSDKHDWDLNDNGIFGEQYGGNLDGVNGIADVFLGRAPTDEHDEVKDFVAKVINYEMYRKTSTPIDYATADENQDSEKTDDTIADDFAISVLLAAKNWDKAEQPDGILDEAAAGKEDIRRLLRDSFGGNRWFIRRRYEDSADAPKPKDPKLGVLGPFDLKAIVGAIMEGTNVVSLSGHGNSGLAGLKNDALKGKKSNAGVFYGNGCFSNLFTDRDKKSLSIQAILQKDGGAVAYVGNSKLGWTDDNPNEYAFWAEMLESGVLGKMFNACRQLGDGWQSYSLNLLGDPAMRVWSDRPTTPYVECPQKIDAGAKQLSVKVSSKSSQLPPKAATVCAIMQRQVSGSSKYDLLATDITDQEGLAVLKDLSLESGDLIEVWVSGKNLIPTPQPVQIVDNSNALMG